MGRIACCASLVAGALLTTPVAAHVPRGELFERVRTTLEEGFYDRDFRRTELDRLAARLAPAADRSASDQAERAVVQELLESIPVSHLGLLSRATHDAMLDELHGIARPTFGFQLVELGGRYFVEWLLEGGPAARAGLLRGDEILALDGEPPARSPRLDWRSDDAALPDPPLHRVSGHSGDRLSLELRRDHDRIGRVRIRAAEYSALSAARASVRTFDVEGHRVGYVHLWYIHFAGLTDLLLRAIREDFSGCEALVLDLRGRGGSAAEVRRLAELLDPQGGSWRRPLVLLTDRGTRSAKEMLAHDLRAREAVVIVGERTAGAVIPATFRQVAPDAVLMYPSSTLGRYTRLLEGAGVEPDVAVADEWTGSREADPILEAGLVAARVWCEEIGTTVTTR